MTRVYGGCIEPGGYVLADERTDCTCPKCEGDARDWFIERNEGGSIDTYSGLACNGCGYREGSHPDDEWAEVWDAMDDIRPDHDDRDGHDAPELGASAPTPQPFTHTAQDTAYATGAPMLLDLAPILAPAQPRRAPFLVLGAVLGLLLGLLLVAIIQAAIPGQPVGVFVISIVAGTYASGGVLIAVILLARAHREPSPSGHAR